MLSLGSTKVITQINFLDVVGIGPEMELFKRVTQGQLIAGAKLSIGFDDDARFVSLVFDKSGKTTWQQLVPISHVVSLVVTPDGFEAKAGAKKSKA